VRQHDRLSRFRAPSIDKCFRATALADAYLWKPATDPAVLPPTVRLPTSFRFRESSRPWKLDPPSCSIGSSPMETMGRTPLVDFCNRIKLRARPHERSNPAHRPGGRPPAQLFVAGGYAWFQLRTPCSRARAGARPAETPWVRGLCVGCPPRIGTFYRNRSRQKLHPNPHRLRHLMSQARDHIGWSCRCRQALSLSGTPVLIEPARWLRLSPHPPSRAVSRVSPRRESRSTHPRCLPSPDQPLAGRAAHSTACPHPVDCST
jgi:hypothetical protein